MAATLSQTAKLLLLNAGALQRLLRREARHQGIRWTSLTTLQDLATRGPLSQRKLAEAAQLRPATLSLLIRELLAEGLVSREPDAQDRRAVKASITPAGRERLERDRTQLAQALGTILESLNDEALEELTRGEAHLAEALRRRLNS